MTPAPCVATGPASNFVFWPFASGVLVAKEISPLAPTRLASPVAATGLKGPEYCVCLPEWARPKPILAAVATAVETKAQEAVDAAAGVATVSYDRITAVAIAMICSNITTFRLLGRSQGCYRRGRSSCRGGREDC